MVSLVLLRLPLVLMMLPLVLMMLPLVLMAPLFLMTPLVLNSDWWQNWTQPSSRLCSNKAL